MIKSTIRPVFAASALLALLAFTPACGDDAAEDPDHAHLEFVTAPPTAMSAATAVDVVYMVHTEGDLHHQEIRACMGHNTACGLGDASSFDQSFAGTKEGESYTASVMLAEGPWTIAVFAHVGETPHISSVIHSTVGP
jgi:hypothetical protein